VEEWMKQGRSIEQATSKAKLPRKRICRAGGTYKPFAMRAEWLACIFHLFLHNPLFFCMQFVLLAAYSTLVSYLAYFMTLKMDALYSSKTSMDFNPTT
jgi:hypothetical protein